jgi:phosphoserine phosphatase
VTPPPWPLVTVDIDGTLTTVHGWRAIADALGRREAFERTQRRFLAREIGEDEHLEEMLEVASGRTVGELERILASTPRIDGIAAGVGTLHSLGSRVALLTHNPSYIGDWYRRTFGFDDFEGTGGQAVIDGVIRPSGAVRADKLSGLRALAERAGVSLSEIVHIGDGWADAALFAQVGAGIALNSSLPEVERAADLVLHSRDFREVVEGVRLLRPRV